MRNYFVFPWITILSLEKDICAPVKRGLLMGSYLYKSRGWFTSSVQFKQFLNKHEGSGKGIYFISKIVEICFNTVFYNLDNQNQIFIKIINVLQPKSQSYFPSFL